MGKRKEPGCFRCLCRLHVRNNEVSDHVAAGPSTDNSDATPTPVVAPNPHIASDSVDTAKGSRPEPRHASHLWDDAYKELQERDADLVENYEKVLKRALESTGAAKDISRHEQMTFIIELRTKSLEEGEWKLKFRGHEVKVKDLIEPVVSIVVWAKDYVSTALEASPAGSLAWAGVCLLLPLLLNPSEQTSDRVQALEKLSNTLRRCRLREALYQRRYKGRQEDDNNLPEVDLKDYYESLKGLCVKILIFQATCAVALFRNTFGRASANIIKLEHWTTLIDAVNEQEQEVRRLEELVKDLVFDEELRISRDRDVSKLERITALNSEVEHLAELIETTKQSEVLKWLATPLDPSAKYSAARKRHGANSGTGKWLIESQTFGDWMRKPNSLLWLHGKAGAGKTILSSTIIHYLKKQFKKPLKEGSTALAYYFFQFDNKDTQTTETMLRSLISNICRHRPSIPGDIEQWHRMNQSPSMEDLEGAFRTATIDFAQVFIIIDALDECPLAERYEVLEAVRRLNKNLEGQQNLHLLLTSRPEVDIRSCLGRLCAQLGNETLDLQQCTDDVNGDIATFIGESFQRHPFDGWSKDIRADAMEKLMQKAQGMFQYVALQIEALEKTDTENDRRAVLDNLPDGLDESYERILSEVPDAKRKFIHRALQFLAYLDHGIRVGELAEIMIVESSSRLDHEKSNIDLLSGHRFDPPERILSMLQGLVMVSGTVQGDHAWEHHHGFINDCRKVRLSHFTVEEYLTSARLKSKSFSIDKDSTKILIAESYLWYHVFLSEVLHASHSSTDEIRFVSPGDSRRRSPWFRTGQNGLRVADDLPLQQWTSTLKDLVTKVLTTSSKSFHRYWDFSSAKFEDGSGFGTALESNSFPLLQFLIRFFNNQLPLFALENALCAVNEKQDPYGTATIVAARFVGKHKILKALLKAGADPYIGGPEFACALEGAIYGQGLPLFDCILTLLEEPDPLKRYSEINYWPLTKISRLHAPWEVKKVVYEKLFSLSPDIKCHEPRPGRALANHMRAGYFELAEVDFLINRFGSSVEGRDKSGATALQWAVRERAPPTIIERLIQRGALGDCLAEDWNNFINEHEKDSWINLKSERIQAANLRKFQQIFGQRYKVSIPAESVIRNDVQRFMDISEEVSYI